MGCGSSSGSATLPVPDFFPDSRSEGSSLLKVVLLGDSGVGKTSLIKRYCQGTFNLQYKATIGSDFSTKLLHVNGDKSVTLQIWDTAGQERFRSLGIAFYRGSDCCILIYDYSDPKSLEHLTTWKEEFTAQAGISNPQQFPFIVLGNKVDLHGEDPATAVVPPHVKAWLANNGNIPHFLVSAKHDLNVDAAFNAAALKVLHLNSHPSRSPTV